MSALKMRRRSRSNKENAKIGRSLPWEDEEEFFRLRAVLSRSLTHENSRKAFIPPASLTELGTLFGDAYYLPACSHSCTTSSGPLSHVIWSSKSKNPDGGVGDWSTPQNSGRKWQGSCKYVPRSNISWELYVDPIRHESYAGSGLSSIQGVPITFNEEAIGIQESVVKLLNAATKLEAAESAACTISDKFNLCSKDLAHISSRTGVFSDRADWYNGMPRLLQHEIGENELLIEQLMDRDFEVQKLLCIEEENLALNELLVRFTRCLIRTCSKTKLLQFHCNNYQDMQDKAKSIQCDLNGFYEHSIMQQAGDPVVNDERSGSADLGYFPVKWKDVYPPCPGPAIEMAIAGFNTDLLACQHLNFVSYMFEHAVESPALLLPFDDTWSHHGQNRNGLAVHGSLAMYSLVPFFVTGLLSVNRSSANNGNHQMDCACLDAIEHYSEYCLPFHSVRSVERWRDQFENCCKCGTMCYLYPKEKNQVQALSFRCCAAMEEVSRLNAELSAQIADFHDLLACLGQEAAKVNVLSKNLYSLGINADDLLHAIEGI